MARILFRGFGTPYGRASLPSRASEDSGKPENIRRWEDVARTGRGRCVLIEDPQGTVVWAKPVDNRQQADDLMDLIHQQVFTASLADFEAWLLTQQVSAG